MKILSYVQARKEIVLDLSEEVITRVLTVSGRAEEWIGRCSDMVAQCQSDTGLVEKSGMGRKVLQDIPREEWVYLVNPSLAPQVSRVVREQVVRGGKLFSTALAEWLRVQEIGLIYRLTEKEFTLEEARVVRLLWNKQESVVEREEIAQAVWGESWNEKYSDWGIDALMHRIRQKLVGNWQMMTIKGRGYMLVGTAKPTRAPKLALSREQLMSEIPGSIYPSDEYLKYMNDPNRVRKVYKDLFGSLNHLTIKPLNHLEKATILCVNSYSYDNVDSVVAWAPRAKIYFVHYDPRAIDMHKERTVELGVEGRVESFYDDLRESKLKDATMDLVINDFRLNFNQNDRQNREMMNNTFRTLKPGGVALISTVVDGRYENIHYGVDQEKAPINAGKPGVFQGDEHLVRRAWSIPYYRQLFEKVGFEQVKEFDIEEGKRWGHGATLSVDAWKGPFYRRWWMRK